MLVKIKDTIITLVLHAAAVYCHCFVFLKHFNNPATCYFQLPVPLNREIHRGPLIMDYCLEPARPKDRDSIVQVLQPFNMHHIPSLEMEEIDFNCFFVVKVHSHIVGAAGYKLLSATEGKTTLLGVLPEYSGLGLGKALQEKRMEVMHKAGLKTVTTNADRPATILWYKKHYGYREVGRLKKQCSFGLEEVDSWTTLKTDLDDFFSGQAANLQRRAAFIADNDAHPLAPYPPLIINACLTGMIPTRLLTPHVPISCEEIIEDAIAVFDAGARMVHLHARNENGQATSEASYFEKIIRGIRKERPDLICIATTSGRNGADFERRAEVLYLDADARPDMASLTLGSLNFLTGPSANSIEMVERLALVMKEQGIKPELEIFDLGMINLARYLERNGLISGRKYFNLLLGNLNSAPATIGSLSALVQDLPFDSIWAGAGLGVFQLPINVASLAAGGHVRVGLEDSIYYDYDKKQRATNRQLVERIVRISGEMQRAIATPDQARALLGL
jgi:3-keto-5-aminohexanoate cleavage enzyme